MSTPRSISRKPLEAHSLQYEYILARGLAAAQRYSGGVWTDYNHHDPGVTLLEQLCYALTDLAYRTHLDISDILFHRGFKPEMARQNMFLPPHEIFPNDPVTELDFRRLIIDRVKKVKNVWVIPISDDPAGYKGLIRILVQCAMDLEEDNRAAIRNEVEALFHQHRPLAQDLEEVVLLKEDLIEFSGIIHLSPDAIGEHVMARIFQDVEHYINPDVNFSDPFEMIKNGLSPQAVFEGPKPEHGFIGHDDLKPKVNTLYVSRIRDTLLKVPGIQELEDFTVYHNGVKVQGNILNIAEDAFPALFNDFEAYPNRSYKLEFFREKVRYDIDIVSLKQLHDALISSEHSNYLRKIQYPEVYFKGRFSNSEFKAYYSLQRELPETYGLGASGLPPGAETKRFAQRKQLKAYLLFFEQIMADYLAQLATTSGVFSINDSLKNTYHTQVPEDIPDLNAVLLESPERYARKLKALAENTQTFYNRRARLLDHLLARFGERYPAGLLRKFQSEITHEERQAVEKAMLHARIRFLSEYPDLSRRRGSAFNYRQPYFESDSWFGLARRLGHLLDFRDLNPRSLVKPIQEAAAPTALDQPGEWTKMIIQTEAGTRLSVLSKPLEAYEPQRFLYFTRKADFLEDIFRFGTVPANYHIVKDAENGVFWTIYGLHGEGPPMLVFGGATEKECTNAIEKAINKWKLLDGASEGLHILEHILLRPKEGKAYRFKLLNEDSGEVLLRGYNKGDFSSQRDIADDVRALGGKEQSFQLRPTADEKWEVLLLDAGIRPVAQIPGVFDSEEAALEQLTQVVNFIKKIASDSSSYEKVVDISFDKEPVGDFPEDFSYSNTCTFFFPSWPSRFQNQEFKNLIHQLVEENLPLHLHANILFLPYAKMAEFELLFQDWLVEKAKAEPDFQQLDRYALKLIDFTSSAINNYRF